MSIGSNIKKARGHMRQFELADLLKIDVSTLSRWENDKNIPNSTMLGKIAEALNTTASYLLGETDNPNPDISALAQILADDDIDIHKPITGGISNDMIIVHDQNTNITYNIPNNDEGRKTLNFLLNHALGSNPQVFANSISGDNNKGNNLGLIQTKE